MSPSAQRFPFVQLCRNGRTNGPPDAVTIAATETVAAGASTPYTSHRAGYLDDRSCCCVGRSERPGTKRRGAEAMDNSYALMDLTVYGGHEPWEDSAAGWPRADLGFAAVDDEIDALAARARGHGAGQVERPVDTPVERPRPSHRGPGWQHRALHRCPDAGAKRIGRSMSRCAAGPPTSRASHPAHRAGNGTCRAGLAARVRVPPGLSERELGPRAADTAPAF